jgi:hypothetical protein
VVGVDRRCGLLPQRHREAVAAAGPRAQGRHQHVLDPCRRGREVERQVGGDRGPVEAEAGEQVGRCGVAHREAPDPLPSEHRPDQTSALPGAQRAGAEPDPHGRDPGHRHGGEVVREVGAARLVLQQAAAAQDEGIDEPGSDADGQPRPAGDDGGGPEGVQVPAQPGVDELVAGVR